MSILDNVVDLYNDGHNNEAMELLELLKYEGDINSMEKAGQSSLLVRYENHSDFSCITEQLKDLGLYIHGFRDQDKEQWVWLETLKDEE